MLFKILLFFFLEEVDDNFDFMFDWEVVLFIDCFVYVLLLFFGVI